MTLVKSRPVNTVKKPENKNNKSEEKSLEQGVKDLRDSYFDKAENGLNKAEKQDLYGELMDLASEAQKDNIAGKNTDLSEALGSLKGACGINNPDAEPGFPGTSIEAALKGMFDSESLTETEKTQLSGISGLCVGDSAIQDAAEDDKSLSDHIGDFFGGICDAVGSMFSSDEPEEAADITEDKDAVGEETTGALASADVDSDVDSIGDVNNDDADNSDEGESDDSEAEGGNGGYGR